MRSKMPMVYVIWEKWVESWHFILQFHWKNWLKSEVPLHIYHVPCCFVGFKLPKRKLKSFMATQLFNLNPHGEVSVTRQKQKPLILSLLRFCMFTSSQIVGLKNKLFRCRHRRWSQWWVFSFHFTEKQCINTSSISIQCCCCCCCCCWWWWCFCCCWW